MDFLHNRIMNLHVFKDLPALSEALADWVVDDIRTTLKEKDHYHFVLSGGSTPKALYALLASEPRKDAIEWYRIHFYIGDERYVPYEDARNNGKMAYDTLLSHVPVPKANVHLMDTTLAPEASARAYAKMLHETFDGAAQTFDLVLLGMGDDGHTLSLFPGTEVVHEKEQWTAAPFVAAQDMYRITLTQPVVARAATIVFLAAGANKAQTLKAVLTGAFEPDRYPSQLIHTSSKVVQWYVDEAAAAQLDEGEKTEDQQSV